MSENFTASFMSALASFEKTHGYKASGEELESLKAAHVKKFWRGMASRLFSVDMDQLSEEEQDDMLSDFMENRYTYSICYLLSHAIDRTIAKRI